MKSIFIETKYAADVKLPDKVREGTPKNLALFMTVQLISQLDSILSQLAGKHITLIQPEHTRHNGQILGCNISRIEGDFDAFLYIGDGLFHPKALAFENEKPIFIYNHITSEFFELDREDIARMKRIEKGAIIKFHSSGSVGLIVSTKPGQNFMRKADMLRQRYPEKNFYIFISDTLDFSDMENYPFIDVYVNTMCPRIALDDTNKIRKPIVNVDKLL